MAAAGGRERPAFRTSRSPSGSTNASAALALYCANGDHYPKAVLTVRKAGKKPLEYLIITMTDVLVTSISTGGSGGEDKLTENVSLNFRDVEVKYTEQKKDGTGGTPKEFKWNIAENAPK